MMVKAKTFLFFIATWLMTGLTIAQISFEKGYYIDNDSNIVEGLIKNSDWRNNPVSFEFKLTENDLIQTMSIDLVQEFGTDQSFKYLRANTNIDRSSDKLAKQSEIRQPQFNKERLFLKVLIEGKPSLLLYDDNSLRRFFIKTDSVEQLVYKTYRTGEDRIGKNETYKQQLLKNMPCPENTFQIQQLEYRRKDLVKIFIAYNDCINSEYTNYEKQKENIDFFHLAVRAGVNFSWFTARNLIRTVSFDRELGPQLGIEAEFTLPFNKNKWSFIIEPTYQSYRSEGETSIEKIAVNYHAIVFAMGVKYYSFINDRSRLFLTGSGNLAYSTQGSVLEFSGRPNLNLHRGINLAFGLGYIHGKISLECRYGIDRAILFLAQWNSNFSTVSFVAGYTIL